jgi:osmotically-inducible protein OsmY
MKKAVLSLSVALALGSSLSGCVALVAGGVAGTALVASDRRTNGAYVDDKGIELKASSLLDKKYHEAHINITSFNRTVLMTGEVATDADRTGAETVIRSVPAVSRVYNYTVVAQPSTLGQRNNDAWISAKVRSRLTSGQGNYSSSAVKVVTERGIVYLMGLVTPDEGAQVAQIVSQTAGVLKVVTLFEYLNAVPALGVAPQPTDAAQPAVAQPAAVQPAATTQPLQP